MKVDAKEVTMSKNDKDLFCGYRDKGNKKRLKQNFDLKVDIWTKRRTNKKTYKRPNGQKLNIYS